MALLHERTAQLERDVVALAQIVERERRRRMTIERLLTIIILVILIIWLLRITGVGV